MELGKYIDHTYLKPEGYKKEIYDLIQEAKENNFFGVCIHPAYIRYAKELLNDSDVKIVTVVGFPLGSNSSKVKAYETKVAIEDGADEIDMVINYGALLAKDYDYVKKDIQMVRSSCNKKLKVIIETCMLSDEDIIEVCKICAEVGVDFVKTSTGFSKSGANPRVVKIMKDNFDKEVKAAGGVRCYEDAINMIKSGATRLGTSSGVKIVNGEISKEGY